jgi:hypothetical protein
VDHRPSVPPGGAVQWIRAPDAQRQERREDVTTVLVHPGTDDGPAAPVSRQALLDGRTGVRGRADAGRSTVDAGRSGRGCSMPMTHVPGPVCPATEDTWR